MQSHQHCLTQPAPRFTAYHFLQQGLSAFLLLIAICGIARAQQVDPVQEYVFSSIEDNLFENPANWSPAYPGMDIPRNAVVFIEGSAYIPGYDLRIQGTLRVGIGATLQAASSSIVIEAGGRLINDGELIAGRVMNRGILNNNLSAYLNLNDFESFAGSMTNNLMAAEFFVSGDGTNGGVFNNYSRCTIQKEFENKATFNQLRRAELMVKGNRVKWVTLGTGVETSNFSLERP